MAPALVQPPSSLGIPTIPSEWQLGVRLRVRTVDLVKLRLPLVLAQQHVGDSSGDGELSSGFRALQKALDHLHLRNTQPRRRELGDGHWTPP